VEAAAPAGAVVVVDTPGCPVESRPMDREAVLRELREAEERVAVGWTGARGQADPPGALRELLDKERSSPGASVQVRARMEGPLMSAIFLSLCRRYGLEPYRNPGQKKTTYMLEGPETFVQEVFWPLFNACDAIIRKPAHRWVAGVLADFGDEVASSSAG